MTMVGFVGLGTMGGHMAMNIRKAGFDMVVHDLNKAAGQRLIDAGCVWADSPKEVGAASDVVFTSLPGPPEVEAVAIGPNGLIEGMKSGTTWFDMSTNSPTVMRRLNAEFAAKGIDVMDSPVSGGPAGAESRKLAIWVGGNQETFDSHKEVLDAMGDQAAYIGAIGAGSIAKLVHNAAGQAVQAALAEVFTMGVKAGLAPEPLWEAVRQGAGGRRRTFDGLAGAFMTGEFDPPAFQLKLAHKDVRLATELAKELGVPMRLTNLTLEEMTEALNRGWGGRDSRVTTLLQQERAGVEIKVSKEAVDAMVKRSNEA